MALRMNHPRSHRCRGAVAPLVAILLVVLLGAAALAIDVGLICTTRAELQNAADAAALAGASAYASDAGLAQDEEALAKLIGERAQAVALNNPTLGKGTILESADIVMGHFDFDDPFAPLDTSGDERFNAVQVTVRRSAKSPNGPVPLFFARVLGHSQASVMATATAVADDRTAGYEPPEGSPTLWPFTLHRDLYDDMVKNGADEYSYDEDAEVVLNPSSDGVREVKLYPWKETSKDGKGNFGLLDIGPGGGSTPELADQIEEGVSPEDIKHEIGSTELDFVDDFGNPSTYEFSGQPGLKSSLSAAVEERIGDVVGIFLHDSVDLSGSNATFTIVGIRFVRVMHIDMSGSPAKKRLVIQPVAFDGEGVDIDPNAPSSGGNVSAVYLCR